MTGTLYSVYGFLKAYWDRESRFGDPDMVKFIRSYQLKAIFSGKAEAAEWAFRQRCHALGLEPGPAA